MFGKNLKLKPCYKHNNILKVVKIFGTFQGEGPYVGYPAIFVRLSGCNLACNFCDTEFNNYTLMSANEIVQNGYLEFEKFKQDKINNNKPLVVITGGEPMIQNISLLCQKFLDLGHVVQIESNGTLICPELSKNVQIVCSPKISNGKYHAIRSDILEQCIAIKFIVSAHYIEYSTIDLNNTYNIPLYIQPMDEYDAIKNAANLDLAMQLSIKYNAILCLQMHKIINIE